jgi:hypothetical protein
MTVFRFNAAVAELLADIRRELGPTWRVIDRQLACAKDPDLDVYLADSKGFRRKEHDAELFVAPDPAT